MNKKQLVALLVLAWTSVSLAQTNVRTVMVDSNGAVVRPSNFQTANSLTQIDRINYVNRVAIQADQWFSMTNNGTIKVSDGRMIVDDMSTNGGSVGIAYYGANVFGHAFLNLDSGSGLATDVGSGFVVQGGLAPFASNVIHRFTYRGVSTNLLYTNTGTNGLDRAGWSVESRYFSNSWQIRLIVHSASGAVESGWSNTSGYIKGLFSYRNTNTTFVYTSTGIGMPFVATISLTNVAGGSNSPSAFGFSAGVHVLSNVANAPYFDVTALYETKNWTP